MVLRPMPRRFAASMRRPPVRASALVMACARTDGRARQDAGVAAREPALGFLLERRDPVGGAGRGVAGEVCAELGRQVAEVDHLPRRHHGKPVAEVLELAHVARKVEPREVRKRVVGDALGLDAELLRAARESWPIGDVLGARAGSAAAAG